MNTTETGQSRNPAGTAPADTERDGVDPATYASPGPESPVWDVPWLAELREVPADATWPRLMTRPHPAAVGSYGPELEDTFRRINGREPRWWQRLAFARIGEHAEDGKLCWGEYLGTLSRQGGKSWALRALAVWRLEQAHRWGEQLVLHTARSKDIVLEVARPAMAWAELHGLTVSRNNGREGISTGNSMESGSRWLLRAKDAVYGLSPGNALVDEGWDVPGRYVDEGVEPTLVEQESPQLGLWSTAHRRATGLMLDRRALAVAQLDDPRDVLLLEWSTPTTVDRADPAGWRMASPFWSDARERMVGKAYRKVQAGESIDPEEPDPVASFDAQWLNRWPGTFRVDVVAKDEPLTLPDEWHACRDPAAAPAPSRPVYVAVEDEQGKGAAAAAAALTPDGRVVAGGYRFPTLREAVDWAQDTTDGAPDPLLLAGASIFGDPELEGLDLPVDPAGGTEFRDALPTLRALVKGGRLAHDGAQDVSSAVVTARVRPNAGGNAMLLTDCASPALLRCLAWVTQRAHRDRE